MGNPPQFFFGPAGASTGRRVGADGKINIICRICEKVICREMYRGYSTAICVTCSGELDKGRTPQEVMEEALAREQKVADEARVDLGPLNFKVTGLGQRMKDVVQKIKVAATQRKRAPLFAKKDKV